MKILLLTHRVPYPPNRGDRIRSFHLLQHLARRGQVWLGAVNDEPCSAETRETLSSYCADVAVEQLGGWRRWLSALRTMTAGRSATEGLFSSRALRDTVTNWGAEHDFDAVVVFCSSMLPYARRYFGKDRTVLIDLVDVDSQKWGDYKQQASGWRRWLFGLEARRVARLEDEALTAATAVVVVSEAEASLLKSHSMYSKVRAIGNGVDLEYFRPSGQQESRPESCVFVGALDYRANIDGIEWFCKEVWPQVRASRPAATLRLVGRNPGASLRQLADEPGVELVGTVDDVRPYLEEAAVSIVPLRVARGIQNKVLESLAMEKAVVASSQSLVGLQAKPGGDVVQASTAGEWVSAILGLFDMPEQRASLGVAGRAYVQRNHQWSVVLQAYDEFLPACADSNASSGKECVTQ